MVDVVVAAVVVGAVNWTCSVLPLGAALGVPVVAAGFPLDDGAGAAVVAGPNRTDTRLLLRTAW